MGYRSHVRSLIYGDPDTMCQLVAAHTLQGGKVFSEYFVNELRRYRLTRRLYNAEATARGPKDERGWQPSVYDDVEVEVLDYYGEDVKWYDDYSDVKAWHELIDAAEELGLSTEFIRIGEESNDIDVRHNVQDDAENYLNVSTSIVDDIPDDLRNVDYEQEAAHG